MHAVMSNAIGSPVEPPSTFAHVARAFPDHHAQTGGAAVQHHTLDDFFSPGAGARNQHDVTVRKAMLGKTPPVLSLKHHDVFAKETALSARFEVKQ